MVGTKRWRNERLPLGAFIAEQRDHVFLSVLPKANPAKAGKEGTMDGQVAVMAVENQPEYVKRQPAAALHPRSDCRVTRRLEAWTAICFHYIRIRDRVK